MSNTLTSKNKKEHSLSLFGKKSILALASFGFITAAILTSCNSSADKVENAQKNVTEAKEDLDKANQEYVADIENYRKEIADKISANDQRIAEFKIKIEHEKKAAKAKDKKRLAELEEKNNNMKMKIDNYKQDGKEKWEEFKKEFNHDMDELGQAFKDLTVNNVK